MAVEVAHNRERFDCSNCRNQHHCDETTEGISRGPAPYPMFVITEIGLESRTCLLPMITEFSHQMLDLYGHYKAHVLPMAGGILDQPNIYSDAMRVIENHSLKLQSEK